MLCSKGFTLLICIIFISTNTCAILASPVDAGLVKHMKEIIGVNNHTTPYFIGIKARLDGEFISEEGILLEDISEAAIYMIDQIDPRIGDCLCMDKHSIRVVSCSSRLPYMCYKNATAVSKDGLVTSAPTAAVTNTTTTVPSPLNKQVYASKPVGNCDADNCSGYQLYENGRCYKFHNHGTVQWYEANRTCTEEGGYLAIINDSAEATLIKEICFPDNKPASLFIWVGLFDITGNKDWKSVHGDDLHTIYNIGSLKNSDFNCAAMSYTRTLYDMRCHSTQNFICEKAFLKQQL